MESPTAEEYYNDGKEKKVRDISAGFDQVPLEDPETTRRRLQRRTDSDPSPGLPVLPEEEFKKLSFCSKLGYVNRLLFALCK